MNHIPCAFVNSTEIIKRGEIIGYFVNEVQQTGQILKELVLTVFEEIHYRHPEAPDDAILTVVERRVAMRAREGDSNYPKLYLMLNAQQLAKSRW